MPSQASYKLILPRETHQTYVNLMAQYHLSHPFADRMREHFVATLAEFVARMQVNSTDKGLKVNIQPSIPSKHSVTHNKDSLSDIVQSQKPRPASLDLSGISGMTVLPEEPGES